MAVIWQRWRPHRGLLTITLYYALRPELSCCVALMCHFWIVPIWGNHSLLSADGPSANMEPVPQMIFLKKYEIKNYLHYDLNELCLIKLNFSMCLTSLANWHGMGNISLFLVQIFGRKWAVIRHRVVHVFVSCSLPGIMGKSPCTCPLLIGQLFAQHQGRNRELCELGGGC